MIVHLNKLPTNPNRVIVLGANGFVGNAILKKLRASHINALGIIKSKIDLLNDIDFVKNNPEWNLSLQTHKYLKIK